MGSIKKFLDLSEQLAKYGSIFAFIVMVVMGLIQVVCRYVLDNSLSFTEELSRFMFIWTVFLASAICVRSQSHAAIGLFVNWMSEKFRKVALLIASLCSISFFALILVKGLELTVLSWEQPSAAMQIPMGLFYLSIPVGALLMLIYSIEAIYSQMNPQPSKGAAEAEVLEC